MRILVAIESCEADRAAGCHTAIRETWGRDLAGKADLRFFVGSGASVEHDDEIRLDAPDDYDSLPLKTKALMSWTWHAGYDYVFKCDVDTFVNVERLMACGFEKVDYLGRFGDEYDRKPIFAFRDVRLGRIRNAWPWASGGVGYFLSRRLMPVIAHMPIKHWAEDFCVGQMIGPMIANGSARSGNPIFDGYVAWHFCRTGSHKKTKFTPQWQYDSYRSGTPCS